MGKRVLYVVVLGAVLGLIFGLAKKGADNDSEKRSPPAPAVTPRLPLPAVAPPPQRATVELPAKGFDIHAVLGQSKRVTDSVLGRGTQLEDGPWNYGVGKVAVDVVFEGGKAALVIVTAPEYHNTAADIAAVAAWVHATDADDVDREHNFNFQIGWWAPGAQARDEHRRDIAHAVNELLKQASPPDTRPTITANYTWLTVAPAFGDNSCNRAALVQLRDTIKGMGDDMIAAGFEVIECLDDRHATLRLR